jgi:hypothetical protein
MTTQRGHRQRLPIGDPRAHPASPGRPLGRPGPLPTTSHDEDQVQVDPPRPSTASASFEGQAPTSGRRHAAMDTAGDHAGHPSHAAAGPHTPRAHPVGHSGRRTHGCRGRHWTPRRSDAAPDTGHVDRHPWDTGRSHRTLDTDAGHERGHGDDSTAGIRTLLGRHAERPHAETRNRVCALALPAGCSAAPPAKRRPGALLSSDDYGSSIERTATLHPLWRAGLVAQSVVSGGDGAGVKSAHVVQAECDVTLWELLSEVVLELVQVSANSAASR